MAQEEGLFESQCISAIDTFSAMGLLKPSAFQITWEIGHSGKTQCGICCIRNTKFLPGTASLALVNGTRCNLLSFTFEKNIPQGIGQLKT